MTFAATCMDLDIIMLSEVKQCYQHHILSLMWNLKKKKKKRYNEFICRTETDSRTLKNSWLPKETGWEGGMGWGFGMEML